MKPPLETVRVSERGREILITLKRKTGIENWNVLCRWALCESLANKNKPVVGAGGPESNIEMKWEVFAGDCSNALVALFAHRAALDSISQDRHELGAYFRAHLERGISQLQSVTDLAGLLQRAL